MSKILYTLREGGEWLYANLLISEEEIHKQCIEQRLDRVQSSNKVIVVTKHTTIIASAIMFHNGVVWDAILSGYTRITLGRKFSYLLPKCYPYRFGLDKR